MGFDCESSGVVVRNLKINKMKNTKKTEGTLKVIHDDKIKLLLENLGLSLLIEKGEIKCKFCKSVITYDNINSIFPESDTIKITCNTPVCILNLTNYINEKNV